MNAIKSTIDLFFNAMYNLWAVWFTNGSVYAYLTFIIVFLYPILNRVIRALRSK